MNKISIEHLSIQYSDGAESLKDVSLNIPAHAITVLFGPAGGGKSTLLRTLNRLNDLADVEKVSGRPGKQHRFYLPGRPSSCHAYPIRPWTQPWLYPIICS